MSGTALLTAADVRSIVELVGLDALMDQTLERFRLALAAFENEVCHTPARSGFDYQLPAEGLIEWMPAWDEEGTITIKVVGYHPQNPVSSGLPTILSNVQVYNTATGHLEAIADGAFLTVLRTGAASGIATDLLGATESKTVGLIGLGAQAVSQLHAMTRVREVDNVLIHDSDSRQIDTFFERIAPFAPASLTVEAAPIHALISASDILCTSTSIAVGSGPLFADQAVKPWLHVNAVGSDFPGKFELPLSFLRRSNVIADFLPQATREGECQRLDPSEIAGTLPEIVQDPDKATSLRSEITVFDSTGWALADHVAMGLLLEHARAQGSYTLIDLEMGDPGPYSPYHWVGAGSMAAGPSTARQAMSETA